MRIVAMLLLSALPVIVSDVQPAAVQQQPNELDRVCDAMRHLKPGMTCDAAAQLLGLNRCGWIEFGIGGTTQERMYPISRGFTVVIRYRRVGGDEVVSALLCRGR